MLIGVYRLLEEGESGKIYRHNIIHYKIFITLNNTITLINNNFEMH